MAKHNPSMVLWKGSAVVLDKITGFKLPSGMLLLPELEKTLFESAVYDPETDKFFSVPMDSFELLSKLGIDSQQQRKNKSNKVTLNWALQFLEQSGFTKKQVQKVTGKQSQSLSVWSHASYQNPQPNYRNYHIELLKILSSGPKDLNSIYTERTVQIHNSEKPRTIKSGNPSSKISSDKFYTALKKLRGAGLVVEEKKPGQKTKIILTKLGNVLMREYMQGGYMPERMRRILHTMAVEPKKSRLNKE